LSFALISAELVEPQTRVKGEMFAKRECINEQVILLHERNSLRSTIRGAAIVFNMSSVSLSSDLASEAIEQRRFARTTWTENGEALSPKGSTGNIL
jgi:hypothetical protein